MKMRYYIYLFVYRQAEVCIRESVKLSNTYLNEEDNIYQKSYSSCENCSKMEIKLLIIVIVVKKRKNNIIQFN